MWHTHTHKSTPPTHTHRRHKINNQYWQIPEIPNVAQGIPYGGGATCGKIRLQIRAQLFMSVPHHIGWWGLIQGINPQGMEESACDMFCVLYCKRVDVDTPRPQLSCVLTSFDHAQSLTGTHGDPVPCSRCVCVCSLYRRSIPRFCLLSAVITDQPVYKDQTDETHSLPR